MSSITISFQENLEFSGNYQLNREVLFIITSLSINVLLKKIPWNYRSRFIVIPRHHREVPLIFRDFWEERIVNVVILDNNRENTRILTYFPHHEKKCSQVGLISQEGVCDDFSQNLTDLYPKKVSNMHGCPLKTVVLIKPPYVSETPSGDIVGIEVELLKIIAYSMNATPSFSALHRKTPNRKFRGQNLLMQELIDKTSDVAAGSLMYTESVSLDSDAVEYFESQCVTFLVPKAKFSAEYALENHISHTLTFLILTNACAVLITPILWYFLRRKKVRKPLKMAIETASAPLIGAVIKAPRNFKLFFITSAWLVHCFIFWKYWEADVSSQLIAPPPLKELETVEDVLATEMTISGESFLVDEILAKYETNAKRNGEAIGTWDVSRALKAIALYRNLSFFGTYYNIMHTLSLNPQFEKMVHIQKKCAAMYSPVIQTETDSPYLEEITKRVYALTEFGITRKLFQRSLDEIEEKIARQAANSEFSPMTLQRISPAFVLLVSGLLFALLCFLAEICFFYSKQKCQ